MRFTWLLIAASLVASGCQKPGDLAGRPAPDAQEAKVVTSKPATAPADQAVYKIVDGRELKLFLDKPPGWQAGDSRPAMVFFHGGGWFGGEVKSFADQGKYLASRGMVCVHVEYRLIDRDNSEPPTICCQDAKSAMRWVRAHAKELGTDPNRIAAGGSSAGAHLASFASLVQGMDDPRDDLSVSPRADALILLNPVFNNGPGEFGHNRVRDRYREFSPAHNIGPHAPPTVVFIGTADKLVAVRVVEQFQADMAAAGVRCDAHYYEGRPHGFFFNQPWKTLTLIEADRFLASLGWLSGEPTISPPAQ